MKETSVSGWHTTWRIIPVSKWFVTPIYKPWKGRLEGGITSGIGDLRSPWLFITYDRLGWSSKYEHIGFGSSSTFRLTKKTTPSFRMNTWRKVHWPPRFGWPKKPPEAFGGWKGRSEVPSLVAAYEARRADASSAWWGCLGRWWSHPPKWRLPLGVEVVGVDSRTPRFS